MKNDRRTSFSSQINEDQYSVTEDIIIEEQLRTFSLSPNKNYQTNFVTHRKYTVLNLLPKFLFLQFRFFFNFFYLIITLSQLIPIFRIGFLVTYVSPLLFVLSISFIKEMWDEFQRYKRDKELNTKKYKIITPTGPKFIESQELRVGHVLEIESGHRVPADLILLKTSEDIGSAFIKTTQLDGETDWKLRRSLPYAQSCSNIFDLNGITFEIEQPKSDIYEFSGRAILNGTANAIGVESTVWCDAVLANGSIIGVVAYTGTDTRSAQNAAPSAIKTGIFDRELNKYSSVLFALLFFASILAAALNGLSSNFHVLAVRFVILFSFIIPISMRCTLDVSKLIYALRINHDDNIEGAIMRNSSIPEELGRVQFLFTDKTGTLTRNEMEFRKLQIDNLVLTGCGDSSHFFTFLSLALCHCVTVTHDDFQASSPDEVALVKHAAKVGFTLIDRDDNQITVRCPGNKIENFQILALLPFSSVWKHMGIVLQNETYGTLFICKGADMAISKMAVQNEWLDEVVGNLAREGLRTLVYCYRRLENEEINHFLSQYRAASTAVIDRSQKILEAFESISFNMDLLGVTGVEDQLQDSVAETLEALEAANIKIWMLTGDKLETAICVALSSRLFARDVDFMVIKNIHDLIEYIETMGTRSMPLVIDGTILQQALQNNPDIMIGCLLRAPAIVVCRCSPSQKELVVKSIMANTKVVTCAVGDGGNDVSMIQAASVGVGIVGKEGKQASLSADCSINTFSHLQRLLLWHGTNSYKHSSRLAQFVMHRGVIMTTTQALYSLMFNFVPAPLYNDWLMMGFATFFTSFPVFSLIFDEFIEPETIMAFPELYSKCQNGRFLSAKTFIGWTWLAIYQGGVIVLLTINSFGIHGIDMRHISSVAYTSLILTELILIALEINKFNLFSIVSELSALFSYFIAMYILTDAFDFSLILSFEFIWKICLVTSICVFPLIFFELFNKMYMPSHEDRLKRTGSNAQFVIL